MTRVIPLVAMLLTVAQACAEGPPIHVYVIEKDRERELCTYRYVP